MPLQRVQTPSKNSIRFLMLPLRFPMPTVVLQRTHQTLFCILSLSRMPVGMDSHRFFACEVNFPMVSFFSRNDAKAQRILTRIIRSIRWCSVWDWSE